ncbi:SRPBCC family protein [Chlorobium sp. KB01]|uniref:SRPBCC family protein n=1 Tax=Chlorobium sp. KB01 TaxID=1917528 RepID=UPI0009766137|nr:SRPBCC family protein [Chlorobium sp. KB01]
MEFHNLVYVQQLPVSTGEAWDFFSNPANLARITPPEMMVTITGGTGEKLIYEGMIITYTLYPFLMVPVRWETEITKVSKPLFFEDVQNSGPYEYWHHRHSFREIAGGVEMVDALEYALPMGLFGEMVNTLIVSRRLEEVFRYRRGRIEDILGRL